jgi:hypothetical protein
MYIGLASWFQTIGPSWGEPFNMHVCGTDPFPGRLFPAYPPRPWRGPQHFPQLAHERFMALIIPSLDGNTTTIIQKKDRAALDCCWRLAGGSVGYSDLSPFTILSKHNSQAGFLSPSTRTTSRGFKCSLMFWFSASNRTELMQVICSRVSSLYNEKCQRPSRRTGPVDSLPVNVSILILP